MSLTIHEGQLEVGRILRELSTSKNVNIAKVQWFTPAGEDPPTSHNLEVYGSTGAMYETGFNPEHLTEIESDNQLRVQVYQKIAGIVGKLKKHESKPSQ